MLRTYMQTVHLINEILSYASWMAAFTRLSRFGIKCSDICAKRIRWHLDGSVYRRRTLVGVADALDIAQEVADGVQAIRRFNIVRGRIPYLPKEVLYLSVPDFDITLLRLRCFGFRR